MTPFSSVSIVDFEQENVSWQAIMEQVVLRILYRRCSYMVKVISFLTFGKVLGTCKSVKTYIFVEYLFLIIREIEHSHLFNFSEDALKKNQDMEFQRNKERFQFLKVINREKSLKGGFCSNIPRLVIKKSFFGIE